MPRLKVFTWSDGFHAFTVAATSRVKALQAWGSEQDLFQTGLARQITDGPDHDAALKTPNQVVVRGETIDVGKVARPRKPRREAGDEARRRAISRLKTRIGALDVEFEARIAQIESRIAALNAERQALEQDRSKRRAALQSKLEAARKAS
ncbi:MAG: hypothetical protein EBR82_37655 [Caulobacteraceae bacterium]|nr:hypothetical protein [Caulobacteraceae bacterium]